MTREDIIRMAREVGIPVGITAGNSSVEDLERFASLVIYAAKEEMLMAGHDEWLEEARKSEREACAKVCENYAAGSLPLSIANAIRSRGQE